MKSGGAARLPAAFREFVRLFNERRFWDSHEVLEQPWRRNRSDFYQGLIIFASAYVHAQRGNPAGVRKQMAKVFGKLKPYRPHYLGVDVDQVLQWSADAVAFVDRHPDLRGPALADSVPYPTLTPKASFIRGDEKELLEQTG